MADKIQVELEVLDKAAQKSVESFTEAAQKSLSSISMATTFTAIVEGFELVSGVAEKAIGSLVAGFSKAVGEANEADQASLKLAESLRLIGGYSEDAVKGFNDFASAVQRTTSFSDNQAISALGLAKSFDLSNAEAAKTVKIATDLAARLGIDLNEATLRLAKTFTGTADKDLKKYFTGLKGLSEAQLIAGKGLDVIAEKVQGAGAAFAGSFQGSIQQAQNSFNKIFEEFGLAVIKTPEVTRAIQALGEQFGTIAVAVAEAAPSIAAVTASLINFGAKLVVITASVGRFIDKVIVQSVAGYNYLRNFVEGLRDIVLGVLQVIFTDVEKGVQKVSDAFKKLNPLNLVKDIKAGFANADKTFDPIIKAAEKAQDQIKNGFQKAQSSISLSGFKDDGAAARQRATEAARTKVLEEFTAQRKEIELSALSEQARIEEEFGRKEKLIRQAAAFGFIADKKKADDLLVGLERERIKKIQELQNKARSEGEAAEAAYEKKRREIVENFAKEPFKEVINIVLGDRVDTKGAVALGAGIVNSMLKGAEGARTAVSSILGGIADAILPGIGPVVSEIVGVLSQGPEKVKEMVTSFLQAIPTIIENIISAIPALIEALIEQVPILVQKIIESLPRIVEALAKSMPTVAFRLALEAPRIAIAFIQAIVKNIPQIIAGFVSGLFDAARQFIQALIDGIKEAFNSIGNGLTGSGESDSVFAGIPVLQGIGDFFGFADGGRIPDLPKYANDRFPAKLSGGEQVFSKDLSERLDQFLSSGSGGGPTQIVVRVGQQDLAKALLNLNRNGFRTA